MNPVLAALKPYPMAQLQARKAAVAKSGKRVFDFGTGDPIEPTPAFIPAALRQAERPDLRACDRTMPYLPSLPP